MVGFAPTPMPPPGYYIAEELKARGITVEDFARHLRIDGWHAERLLDGGLRIDEPFAAAIGQLFEVSPDLFLNLQRAYDDQ